MTEFDPRVALRVARSRGRWIADIRYDNPFTRQRERVRHVLDAGSKREAERMGREFVDDIRLRLTPGRKNAAFSGLAALWLERTGPTLKPSTRQLYESVLRVHLVPAFQDLDVRLLGIEQVEELRAKLSEGRSAKTVNNIIAILGKLIQDGIRWGYADANPVRQVKKLRVTERTPVWWSVEEAEAALAEAKATEPQWHLFLLIGLRTGLRFGELAGLRWSDVNLEQDPPYVHVQRAFTRGEETTPKNHRSRRVPMASDVKEALEAVPRRERQGRVLRRPSDIDAPLHMNSAKKALRRIASKAQVTEINLHAMRHTFCSHLAAAGVPLVLIQQWAGHADIQTTMRYAHLAPMMNAGAIEALVATTPTRPAGTT